MKCVEMYKTSESTSPLSSACCSATALSCSCTALLRSASVHLCLCHGASTPCVFGLGLLQLRLLSVDLFAELGCTRLVLHNLRVHVLCTPRGHLVLMLLIHLLLSIVALLCSWISWLIGCDISTCICPLLILLLGYRSLHLLLIIHCLVMMVLGTKVGIITVLLLTTEVILLILLVFIGYPVWTRDILWTAIVRSRAVLSPFIVFRSIGWPVNPITKWLATATKDWEGPQITISAKDLFPILAARNVIQTLIWVALHL